MHILEMKNQDEDYARQSLKDYDKLMPWLDLIGGVRDALRAGESNMKASHE